MEPSLVVCDGLGLIIKLSLGLLGRDGLKFNALKIIHFLSPINGIVYGTLKAKNSSNLCFGMCELWPKLQVLEQNYVFVCLFHVISEKAYRE